MAPGGKPWGGRSGLRRAGSLGEAGFKKGCLGGTVRLLFTEGVFLQAEEREDRQETFVGRLHGALPGAGALTNQVPHLSSRVS